MAIRVRIGIDSLDLSRADTPDRPPDDFRASAVRHASMGSYGSFVECKKPRNPGAFSFHS